MAGIYSETNAAPVYASPYGVGALISSRRRRLTTERPSKSAQPDVANLRPEPFGTGYTIELPDPPEPSEKRDGQDKEPSFIRHRDVFITRYGRPLHTTINDQPTPLVSARDDTAGTVFDIVNVYECSPMGALSSDTFEYITYRDTPRQPSPEQASKPRKLPTVSIRSMRGKRRLDLRSPSLLHALRNVVSYWPDLDLASSCLELYEPYSILVHHSDELEAYAQKAASSVSAETCDREQKVAEHWNLVKSYLDANVMPAVTLELARHKRGYATFEQLWLLFKPGTDVVVTITDSLSRSIMPYRRGLVVESVSKRPGASRDVAREGWTIGLWGLQFDGSSIGRAQCEVHIEPFDGEIEVSTMNIVPAGWRGHTVDDKPWEEVLRANGQKAYSLLRPQCFHHIGRAKEFPYNNVDGLVIVDMKTFFADSPKERPYLVPERPKSTGVTTCDCEVCSKLDKPEVEASRKDPFTGYDDVSTTADRLTQHQSFLFPSRVFAYHFHTRAWELVEVQDLGPAQFQPNILDTLVMKSGRIRMLKALSRNYVRTDDEKYERHKEFWSADFIEGKGKSQIILLHGRPGVGKTYTAECIAEHTRRPLMSLTCADIGTYADEVEQNLAYHFTAARDWGAFVLIDEADIYMEKRSSNDLSRNSLVASFLRALETYEGLLFLTTNRVGAFDDAFVSRIHVKLYYPPLQDEDRQKIWMTFITKLSTERRKDIRVTLAAKEYIAGSKIKSLDLNGREIRNAFQTAVALAEYERTLDEEGKILVEDQHIEQVADMSRDFQLYLEDLHQGNEEKRAKRAFERHDNWVNVRGKSH